MTDKPTTTHLTKKDREDQYLLKQKVINILNNDTVIITSVIYESLNDKGEIIIKYRKVDEVTFGM